MKLPGVVQGQNLNRISKDENLLKNTLMVQDAERNLLNTVGNAALGYQKALDEAKLASAVGSSLQGYEELLAYINNKEVIDISNDPIIPPELRQKIIEAQGIQPGDGQTYVSSHLIRGMIHDYHVKQIRDKGHKAVGNRPNLLKKYDNALTKRTSSGAAEVITLNLKEQKAEMSALGDMRYSQEVKAGDVNAARDVIVQMGEAGIWSPDKVSKHLINVVGDVQYEVSMQAITTGDANTVRGVLGALSDPAIQMTADQRNDIYNRSNAILKEKEKERKEVVERTSKQFLNDDLLNMYTVGMSWSEIAKRKGALEPIDMRSLINAKRAQITGGSTPKDNPATANLLSVMIGRLSIRDPDVPHATRKANVISMLNKAMGYDDKTGQYDGTVSLTSSTYFRLMDEINKSDDRVLDSPRLELVIDRAYKVLTGAGRDMVSQITGDRTDLIAAAEYERAIIKAAFEQGPGFDPDLWHEQNWNKFRLSAVDEAYSKFRASQLQRFIVTKEVTSASGKKGKVTDIEATQIKIEDALTNGELDDDMAINLINELTKGVTSDAE